MSMYLHGLWGWRPLNGRPGPRIAAGGGDAENGHENDGHKNDAQSKLQDMKLQDMTNISLSYCCFYQSR